MPSRSGVLPPTCAEAKQLLDGNLSPPPETLDDLWVATLLRDELYRLFLDPADQLGRARLSDQLLVEDPPSVPLLVSLLHPTNTEPRSLCAAAVTSRSSRRTSSRSATKESSTDSSLLLLIKRWFGPQRRRRLESLAVMGLPRSRAGLGQPDVSGLEKGHATRTRARTRTTRRNRAVK